MLYHVILYSTYTPKCNSIKGPMVFIRLYLGSLNGYLGGCWYIRRSGIDSC